MCHYLDYKSTIALTIAGLRVHKHKFDADSFEGNCMGNISFLLSFH